MQTKTEILNKTKDLNPLQLRLLDILINNGSKTRDQICEIMGYKTVAYKNGIYEAIYHKKRTTIYDNLRKLLVAGIVEKQDKHNGMVGRPPVCWKIVETKKN